MERAQYDTAIHSNPDADTWAKFFKEHFPDGKEVLFPAHYTGTAC